MITLVSFCPNCHGRRIHPSRARVFDLPFRLMLMTPVRCGECDRRFYRPRWLPTVPRENRRAKVIDLKRSA